MSRKKTGREGLLVWLQSRTSGYDNVNIVDFTDSWVDGLAFCALLHSFCPELVKYEELTPASKAQNLQFAFTLAEKLGIPKLIQPTDMLVESGPNKFLVITYLSQFVDHFRHESKPEPLPQTFLQQYEAQSTYKQQEVEHKKRVRNSFTKGNVTRSMDRMNFVKSGMVAGKIKELKRIASTTRLSPSIDIKRGGSVTERIAEYNRKTGAQTTHRAGNSFISERVPSGLVADRIATFLKLQRQMQLDIEFVMVSSPKVRRARRSTSQSPTGQYMSQIYYVMRQEETISNSNSIIPSAVHHPVVEPLSL